MDDILFRHTAIATPNDKDDAFVSKSTSSDNKKKLVAEAKEFDQFLADSLDIEVPNDLVDKIMLEQSFAIEHDKTVNNRWHVAIAASVAFIIGLSVPMLNSLTQPLPNIGSVALQHVQQEYFFTAKANEKATIQNVNMKLARYGGTARDGLGKVLYVNHCRFEGTSALHMILEGEKGQVTVFVVPENADFEVSDKFNNQHLKGIAETVGHANVVIVGERGEPLNKMREKLAQNIQWDI